MRIEELHLKNFRCFKELDIQFPKSNLAVFIGLNGAGKSAILDAIMLLFDNYPAHIETLKVKPFNFNVDDILVNESTVTCKIVFNFNNNKKKWGISHNNSEKKNDWKIEHEDNNQNFVNSNEFICIYYNSNREKIYNIRPEGFQPEDFEHFYWQIIEQINIENKLIQENNVLNYENLKLDVVRKSINIFFSSISGVEYSNFKINRDYYKPLNEQFFIEINGVELKISQLSSGQKLLLLLVADIAFKLVNIDSDNITDIDTVLKRNGIVLIDEIELHLHPQWQREVLPALQKTFPNIQFIVTTHSPQVLSNLKKEEIFILKDSKVSEFKPYVEGRDSNSILSEIFGVSERPKIFQEKLNEFYKAVDNKKLEEAKKLLKNLEEYWGTSDTEILKADLHLSFAEE